MILLTFTILSSLITLVLIAHGSIRHGWTHLYFIPLAMLLVALTVGVVGYLA